MKVNFNSNFNTFLIQVALKRQQAAEDAIALSFRVAATGATLPFLPQGPIFGLPVTEPKQTDLVNKGMYLKILISYQI